jgi:hypothetical protein
MLEGSLQGPSQQFLSTSDDGLASGTLCQSLLVSGGTWVPLRSPRGGLCGQDGMKTDLQWMRLNTVPAHTIWFTYL